MDHHQAPAIESNREFSLEPSEAGYLAWRGAMAATCLMALPLTVQGTPVFTLPRGLSAGQHYRIIFVTAAMERRTT